MPIRIVALIAALIFAMAQTWQLSLSPDPLDPLLLRIEYAHR